MVELQEKLARMEHQAMEDVQRAEEERIAMDAKAAEEARLAEEVRIVEEEKKRREAEEERQAAIALAEYQQKAEKVEVERIEVAKLAFKKMRGHQCGASQGKGKGAEGDEGEERSGSEVGVREGRGVEEARLGGQRGGNSRDCQVLPDGTQGSVNGQGGSNM